MADDRTVVYVGLRRSLLEWSAELDAATRSGAAVQVCSDVDITHTGLPEGSITTFARSGSPADLAGEIVEDLRRAGRTPLAVACWGDRYVPITAHLASELGLRGVGLAAATTCTDKIAQRNALQSLGLNPGWWAGTTIEELRSAVDAMELPLVFKLAHSSGGRGTTLITESTDLDDVLKLTSLNYVASDAFVVEEFVHGTEHSVSGVVGAGTVKILGVSDKLVRDCGFDTWATIVPSALTDTQVHQLERAAEQAVHAVGVESGGFHVDVRLTDAGPIALEVGARLGGDLINSHLIPLASDSRVQPYRALVDVLTTGVLPEDATYVGSAAMLVVPASRHPMDEVVDHALAHPYAHTAVDWSTPDSTAVAVVISTAVASDVVGLIEDVQSWMRW